MSRIAILINEAKVEAKAKAVATEKKTKEEQPEKQKNKTLFDSAVNIARQFVKDPATLAKLVELAKSKNIVTAPIDASFFDNYYDKYMEIWRKMGGGDGAGFYLQPDKSVKIKGSSGTTYQVSLDEFEEFRNASRMLKRLNDLRVLLIHQQAQEAKPAEEPKKETSPVEEELAQYQQVYNRSVKITFKVLNDLEKYLTKYKDMFDNEGMSAYSSNINSLMGILGFIKSGLVAKFIDKNAGKDVESLSNELSKVVTQISGVASEVIKNSPIASKFDDSELGNNAEEPALEQPQDVTKDATRVQDDVPPPASQTPPTPIQTQSQQAETIPADISAQANTVETPEIVQKNQEPKTMKNITPSREQNLPQSSAEEMGGEVSSVAKNSLVRGFTDGNIENSTYGEIIKNIVNILNAGSEASNEIKEDLSSYLISNKVVQKLDKYIFASVGNRLYPNEILKRYLARKAQAVQIMKYISPKVLKTLSDTSSEGISVPISKYFNDIEDENSIYNKNSDNLTEQQVETNQKLNEEYQQLLLQQVQSVNEQMVRDFIRNTLKNLL